jgi:hypothetical protein
VIRAARVRSDAQSSRGMRDNKPRSGELTGVAGR